MINKKPIILILCLLVFSCSQKERKGSGYEPGQKPVLETFEEFNKLFPELKGFNWEIYSGYESMGSILLQLHGQSGDTTLVASLLKASYEDENGSNINYILSDCLKKFSSMGSSHVQKINRTGDILYHYSYNGGNRDYENLTFVSGKYRYLFENRLLDAEEYKYYLANKDSLDAVKGDIAFPDEK